MGWLLLQIGFFGIWVLFFIEPSVILFNRAVDYMKQILGIASGLGGLEIQLRKQVLGGEGKPAELHVHKFYHKLADNLNRQKYTMGISVSKPLKELIEALGMERKFSNKIKTEFQNSLLQFLIVCFVTWAFAFAIAQMLDIKLENIQYAMIALLELLGVALFVTSFGLIFHKKFKSFDSHFELFYTARSLWHANFAVGDINGELGKLNLEKDKKFRPLMQKYQQLMELGTRYGTVGGEDLDILISELWILQEKCFEDFVKILTTSKFLHLICFFVSGYFLLLYFVLERMEF